MAKLKQRPKLAYVKWFDASYQDGQFMQDELNPNVILHSGGLIAAEDRKTISLALDRYDDDGTWRHITHIPKVNILKIVRF